MMSLFSTERAYHCKGMFERECSSQHEASYSAVKRYFPTFWFPLLLHICHTEWFQIFRQNVILHKEHLSKQFILFNDKSYPQKYKMPNQRGGIGGLFKKHKPQERNFDQLLKDKSVQLIFSCGLWQPNA